MQHFPLAGCRPWDVLVQALEHFGACTECARNGRLVARRCSDCWRHPVAPLLASPAQPSVPHRRLPLRRRSQRVHTRRLTMRRNHKPWARRLCQLAQGKHGVAAAAAALGRSSRRSRLEPGRRSGGLQGLQWDGPRRRRPPRLCAPCSRCRRLRTTRHCRCAPGTCADDPYASGSLADDGGCGACTASLPACTLLALHVKAAAHQTQEARCPPALGYQAPDARQQAIFRRLTCWCTRPLEIWGRCSAC